MKTPGEILLSKLKDPTLLDRKPSLKLYPNHFREEIYPKRVWSFGPAVKDGKGWYRAKTDRKIG